MTWSRNGSYTARRADDNSITHNMRSRNVRAIKKRLWNQDISIHRLCNAHRRMLNAHRRIHVIWVSQQSESTRGSHSTQIWSVWDVLTLRTNCQKRNWWLHKTDHNQWRTDMVQRTMKKVHWITRWTLKHRQGSRNFDRSKEFEEVKKSQAFSVRLETKKLLMSQWTDNDQKIWIDVEISLKKWL